MATSSAPAVLLRCAVCGSIYSPAVAHITEHCSPTCQELSARRRAARMGTESACDYCGAVFPDQKLARKSGRRYCNRHCYGQHRIEETAKRWMATVALTSYSADTLATTTHQASPDPAPVTPTRPLVVYEGVEFELCWNGTTEQWGERGGLLHPRSQRTERLVGGPDSLDTEEEQ